MIRERCTFSPVHDEKALAWEEDHRYWQSLPSVSGLPPYDGDEQSGFYGRVDEAVGGR